MLVIDSCHSGTISRAAGEAPSERQAGSRLLPVNRTPEVVSERDFEAFRAETSFLPRRDNLAVWSAVTATQEALEDLSKAPFHGVFTRAFAHGLLDRKADVNKNGRVSYSELFQYVRRQAKAFCDRRNRQSPRGRKR